MTSVLNVDTIADKAGTGPVGLTKQSAAKAFYIFNQDSTTHRGGITTNDSGNQSLNASSYTDNTTGDISVDLINSFSDAEFIMNGGSWAANKLITVDYQGQTSGLCNTVMYDADTSSATDGPHEVSLHGDLA
tara:strand:- start:101 stop:496 length:396 start_codon:yes stop_codon:yes gene_type:complete